MMNIKRSPLRSGAHDHKRCVQNALGRARRVCEKNHTRLTPIREQVLDLVWASHKPIGAYKILDALRKSRHNATPPTVYRALDFLQRQGLIHKIVSLNAYLGCCFPERGHYSQFFICSACHHCIEDITTDIGEHINRRAKANRFTVGNHMVEIHGLCANCQHQAADFGPYR